MYLCIDCGESFPGDLAGKRCPSCAIELIDMQMAKADDRLRVLLSLADTRRLRRVESIGLLGGAAVGIGAGLLLLWVVPELAVMLFAVPLLLALLVGQLGWLLLPVAIAKRGRSEPRPLVIPAGRSRKKALVLSACVVGAGILPLTFAWRRAAADAAPAKVTIWNDGHPGWTRQLPTYIAEIEAELQGLAACAPPSCEAGCPPMALVGSITASGAVESVLVTPAGGVAECVRGLAASWRLPPSPNAASYLLDLPFVFTQRDGVVRVAHPTTAQALLRARQP